MKCENNTDTCVSGSCQCGDNPGLVCNVDGQLPFCQNGQCACSKTVGSFEPGDGTTRGSCDSPTHKCHLNGQCSECSLASHCSGLTDSCINGLCKCGNSGPCNPLKSNTCTNGVCYCGTKSGGCSTIDYFDAAGSDPRTDFNRLTGASTGATGLQHIKEEVCEEITEYYNPRYIKNHYLMVNSTDSNNQPSGYATEYDDMKGSQGVGTYQCLGTFITLATRYIFHIKKMGVI